ncbi:MAG: winged helix-turn-helix domain-containing protein [Pseudomonadota bacterium]
MSNSVTTCFQFDEWLYRVDDFVLIHSNGESIQLEPRLGRLLEMFCSNPGQVLNRDHIIAELWAPRIVSDESLTVAISQLRRYLRQTDTVRFIKTVSGRGYVWQPETKNVTAPTSMNRTRKMRRWAMGILGCTVAVALGVALLWSKTSTPNASTTEPAFNEQLNHAAELVTNKSDIDGAIRLYRDVLAEGPNATAYFGLAQAKLARISHHEIPLHANELTGLLERALEEDPALPEAEWLLGMVHFYGHWDFAKAKTMLVAEFNGHNRSPRFLQQFSEVMLALGEAAWVERAIHELRSHHPEFYAAPTLAWLQLLSGDPDSARQEIDRILAVEPASYNLHVSAQHVAYQAGDMNMAWFHLDALLELAQVSQASRMQLQQAFSNGGIKAVHSSLMDDLVSSDLGHYRPPIANARHAVVAGDHERAIAYIDQAIEQRQWEALWLLADPHYAPLYEHPDFIAVANKFRRITEAN